MNGRVILILFAIFLLVSGFIYCAARKNVDQAPAENLSAVLASET